MTAPATCTDTPTALELLDQAGARLDALAGQPLTEAEFELWRITAHLAAALRAHLGGHTGRDATGSTA